MVRTQVQFEAHQYERVRQIAFEQRVSFAEAVRRLVDRGMAATAAEPKGEPRSRAILKLAGIGNSGLTDLGLRHDDYLAEDLAKEHGR